MNKEKELKSGNEASVEPEYEVIEIGDMKYTLKYCTAVPEASEEENEELLQDCAQRGFLTPIFIDETGNVIDGRRKLRSAKKLKRKDFTTKIFPGLSEAQKWQLAQDLNFHRRQLTKEEIDRIIQRNRERIPELALSLRVEGKSYRMIGDELGVSPETARKAVNQASTVQGKTVDLPQTVCGKDGKKRSAKGKLTTIYAATSKETERAIGACKIIGNRLPNGNITVKRAERLARNKVSEELRQQDTQDYQHGEVTLLQGDFRKRATQIPDRSVNLVMTDPLYAKDALSLWKDLGEFCKAKLKPGGILATYTGMLYLPQVMQALGENLQYVWPASIYHSGGRKLVPAVRILQRYKIVLIYANPPVNIYWKPFCDMITGGQSKEHHEYEQSVAEALYFIQYLCPKNGVMVDPFMGSGTSIIAGLQSGLGIRCLGIEIDKATFTTAQNRIQQIQDEMTNSKETA